MSEAYQKRINRVVDHIQANLGDDLSLKHLSRVACFSEFHFNRVFKAIMGESVYQFVRRLRLEKAAELLLTNTNTSITEIALSCGFATPSSFAKSFKKYFKMNATEWRDHSNAFFDKESTPIQIDCGQVSLQKSSPVWTFSIKDSIRQVVIEDISPFKVAYIRNVGPYQGDDTLFDTIYRQLSQWAVPRGYLNDTTCPMNIYYDNPEITENQKLRVMVAMPVEDDVQPSGRIGVTKISGGKYGVCRFWLKKDEFADAWGWLFSTWLKQSGYERDSREAFERCLGEKRIDGERMYNVDICVPVKTRT